MKTNLRPYSTVMSGIAENIEKDIISFMKGNGYSYLDLQPEHTNGDMITAFVYGEDYFIEEQIVAIKISKDGTGLDILTQEITYGTKTVWDDNDIEESADDDLYVGSWNPLFGSDICGVFTAYNLADGLDYINFE